MRTLKLEVQPDKFVFRYRLSNVSRLLPASDYCRALFRCLDLISTCSAVVGSWKELPNIWLTAANNAIVGLALSFRVRMLLKSAVTTTTSSSTTCEKQKINIAIPTSWHRQNRYLLSKITLQRDGLVEQVQIGF